MKTLRKSLGLLFGKRPAAIQVGALCLDDRGRVLLITSRSTGRWVIPKGWPMEGRSLPGAAAREAWEEAGVIGRVDRAEIGRYTYLKQQDQGYALPVEVSVFPLRVSKLADNFPESKVRRRQWFDPSEAARLVAEPGLARILDVLSRPLRAGNG